MSYSLTLSLLFSTEMKKCQRLNLGISYVLCPMSYSSSFGCYLAFFNFGIEHSEGGKKRLQKNNLYKEGEDTLAFKCPKDCFLESLGMHKD